MRFEVRDVLLAQRGVGLLAVERLVGKADAGLEEVDDVAVRLGLVREHLVADEPAHARRLQRADGGGEFVVAWSRRRSRRGRARWAVAPSASTVSVSMKLAYRAPVSSSRGDSSMIARTCFSAWSCSA